MEMLSLLLVAFVIGNAESVSIFWNGTCPLVKDWASPDNQYITYTLFTSPSAPGEVLNMSADNIASTSFNAANPTKIIIHGFTDSPAGFPAVLKTAYVTKGGNNVIMVDWSFLAQGPVVCYPTAAMNIRYVGQSTAQLVTLLRSKSATNFHVVGHSLGGQTANFIAQNLATKLTRISGLDPANSGFGIGTPLNLVLDSTDATFVDVYHTNNYVLGKAERCGHVDFYFNTGTVQPGCGLDAAGMCAHHRSIYYFAESITPGTKKFYGKKCTNLTQYLALLCSSASPRTILAGEDVLQTTTGVVTVPTNSISLFAKGQ